MSDTTSYQPTSFVDGKVAKLRASCDACNESKVRCSQAKPNCARCEKQGITCVYGLSRRSHKNAPRIRESHQVSESSSSPSIDSSIVSSGSILSQEHSDTTSLTNPSLASGLSPNKTTHGSIQTGSGATTAFQNDLATGPDNSFLLSLNQMPDFSMYGSQLMNSDDSTTNLMSVLDPIDDISMAGNDFFGQCLSLPSPDSAGGTLTQDGGSLTSELPEDGRRAERQICSCVPRVIKQLVSMPLGFGDENASFDSQLSQLRQAINVSEDCINCNCTSRDDMSISMVTISILVGHVIQGFESTLGNVSSSSSRSASSNPDDAPQTTSSSSGQKTPKNSLSSPRLSWGVLQIDPDEEDELKQHMWLLQFRKLQRVLLQFNNASTGQQSRNTQQAGSSSSSGGDSAHLMASQCIHTWLAQRADVVKNKYQAKNSARAKSSAGVLK